MLNMKKGSLLRKGIAVFLLMIMVGSSFAFATENTESTEPAEDAQHEEIEETATVSQPTGDFETLRSTTDERADTLTEAIDVDVESGTDSSEEVLEEIKEEEKVVIFAQGNENLKKTVKLYYNKRIKYENYRTHDFHVMCDGESLVAYCIEPTQSLGSKRTFTATPCSSVLLSKALYYSYGNPGYHERSEGYLKGLNLKSSYTSSTGRYAFCHVMLSYVYDGESGKGDAFKGCSANTKSNVRKFVAAIKTWPDPPTKSELGLSAPSFKAVWNEELELQETPEINVIGTTENSINLPVPENVTLVKGEEIITSGNVNIAVGEAFKLRAPVTVRGQYTSPTLTTSMTDFQPYIIKLSGRQDQMFGINTPQTLSFSINWVDFGRVNLIKTSSNPEITEGNTYYSLNEAEYGLYSEETDKKYANLTTDEEGKASVDNIPYGEYYLKELEPSRGYEIDDAKHHITVGSPAQSETVLEKPAVPVIATIASISETGQSSTTAGGSVNISDIVKYSDIEPGINYTIVGRLMNKATEQEIPGTTRRVEFTPENPSGSLKMDYTLDSSGLGGNTVVAFEKLYQGDNLIAAHEDINNKAQSVDFVKPKDRSPDTGDDTKLWFAALTMAFSLLLGIWMTSLKKA